MSSSSTSTSAGEEITFPPSSSASSAASASTSTSTSTSATTEAEEDVAATVVSYAATEGDADSAVSEDCDSRGASHGNSFGNGMSSPSNSNGNNNNGNNSNGKGGENDEEYRRTHGTCEFYPTASNSSSCQMQRSCYDCLNFNITSEPSGCFVNSLGICKRLSDYNPELDYRLGRAANNYSADGSSSASGSGSTSFGANVGYDGDDDRYDFLASAATYCEQNDAQCLSCIANQFSQVIYNNSGDSRSSYCYGEDNCICVAVCEARRLNPPHMDSQCFANTMSASQPDSGTSYGSVFMMIGAMVMVVIVVFAIYRVRTRGESAASETSDDSNNSNNAPMNRRTSDDDRADIIITPDHNASPIAMAVPVPVRSSSNSIGKGQILLNLFNWQAMREVLVQREQMRAEGIDPAALSPDTTGLDPNGEPNVDKGDVQFLDVKPSAPEVEKDMASAPAVPVITVPSAPVVWTVRAMAGPASPSAPSAPDFDDFDFEDVDAADMRAL